LDKGIWATWYNLAAEHRDVYLSWLHDIYIPWVLKRPGLLWAAHYAVVDKSQRPVSQREKNAVHHTDDPAVPAGQQYVLIFGAAHAGVFGNPVPGAINAELPDEGRKMLAMRTGERINVMTENDRIECQETNTFAPGKLLAPCIQFGTYNCPWQHEEEMLAWYTQWRMPAMGRTPGVIRTRKLSSVFGWAKHGVLYEFVSLESRNQYFPHHEDQDPDMKAWSDRMVPRLLHAPGSPSLACRIWPKSV